LLPPKLATYPAVLVPSQTVASYGKKSINYQVQASLSPPVVSLRITAHSLFLSSDSPDTDAIMQLPTLLALAASSAWLAAAAPSVDGVDRRDVRLIKTSPQDPGKWVTEEEKISQYISKGKHFIDITDIKVESNNSPSSQDSKSNTLPGRRGAPRPLNS